MINSTSEPIEETNLDLYISNLLYQVVGTAFVVVGTVCNILTLLVLNSRHLGSFPTAPFFGGIAIGDIGFLIFGLGHWVLYLTTDIYLADKTIVMCKLRHFLAMSSDGLTVWLVVAVTLDRLYCVVWPIKANNFTKKHRIWIIIMVTIASSLYNSHYAIGNILKEATRKGVTAYFCMATPGTYAYFAKYVRPKMRVTFIILVPFFIITIANVFIVRSLRRNRKEVERMATVADKSKESEEKIVQMVILLSVTFLLLYIPVSIYNNIVYTFGSDRVVKLYTVEAILYLLVYFNHVLNFFIYCISGPRFRYALKSMFGCG